jgi:hypothetical protein
MPFRWKAAAAAAILLIAAFAYVSLFSRFSAPDDEGYNVSMTRMVSEGEPLYTGDFAIYGPFPYLSKAAALRVLGVPVTHETSRLIVLVIWIVSSVLLALAIWYLTGGRIVSFAGLLLAAWHLRELRHEPGHPEDFVVLLISSAILLAAAKARWISIQIKVGVLGLIGALLLTTKINVGLFYCFGLAMWILALLPRSRWWKPAAVVFTFCATMIPFALMKGYIDSEAYLFLIVISSILFTAVAWFRWPLAPHLRFSNVLFTAACLLAGLGIVVLLTVLSGSRLGDTLNAVVFHAARLRTAVIRPVDFGQPWPFAILILAFVWVRSWQWFRPNVEASRQPPAVLKVTLALAALLLGGMMIPEFYMVLVAPVCWLIVRPDGRNPVAGPTMPARVFLCSIAVFEMLQAFPVHGPQIAWSTLGLFVCCLVLLHDGMHELSLRPAGMPAWAKLSVAVVGGTTAIFFVLMFASFTSLYIHSPGLGFNGSRLIRLPMSKKAPLDWIVASTAKYCDAIVTQPGLDSFPFWSGKRRQSPLLPCAWPSVLSVDEQTIIVSRLKRSPRTCAVYNKQTADWWTDDTPGLTRASVAQEPLVAYIRGLQLIGEAGGYQVRGTEAVRSIWTEDYVLAGERQFDGGHDAVGIPAELLRDAGVTVSFDFEASKPGPLLSVQLPGSEATQPLLYIGLDGALIIDKTHGPLVADRRWHHVELQRGENVWTVTLDGERLGDIRSFLTGREPPKYLQLGPDGRLRDVKVKHDFGNVGQDGILRPIVNRPPRD